MTFSEWYDDLEARHDASYSGYEDTCLWDPPVPYPDDGNDYRWDEETTSWVVDETNETQS